MNAQYLKNMIKKEWLTLLGIALGLLGGFLYWRLVGCSTGSCPITASPWISSLWGGVMGGLLFSLFKPNKNKKHEN